MGAVTMRKKKQRVGAGLLAVVLMMTMLLCVPEVGAATATPASGTTNAPGMADASPTTDDAAYLAEAERAETAILSELRALQLDIARDEAEMERLTAALAEGKTQLEAIERDILRETERYDANRETLSAVLATYQVAGPGSRLELLLSSDSLSTFLRRLSALRQLDRDTAALLDSLEAGRNALVTQQAEKKALLDKLDQDRALLAQSLDGKHAKEATLEASLTALAADRTAYEAQLAELARTWDKAMDVFPELTDGFSRIITEGAFPPDALSLTFGLAGMTAVMRQDRFQAILDADKRLPKTVFRFRQGVASLQVESAALALEGDFVVIDGITLEFRPKSGSQGGLELTVEQLADLSRRGALQFRLEPILQGTTIRRIKLQDGQFTLSVNAGLF